MNRLFDTVVIVDWSARSTPSPARPSGDAIWWAVARDGTVEAPVYARTRQAALDGLTNLLQRELRANRRVLVGFDFPFGYPAGVARRVTGTDDALALWAWLADRIEDGPNNTNNRFSVAEAINALYTGIGPFWGRPESWDHPGIPTRGTVRHGTDHPPDRRLIEQHQKSTQPVWKLYTTGSVGSQVLLGLPALQRLRHVADLAGHILVWPFQTGLDAPDAPLVLVEIYPSLIAAAVASHRREDEILDAAQVRVTAGAYAALDRDGALGRAFEGPDLSTYQRDLVAREEAWILGWEVRGALAEAA